MEELEMDLKNVQIVLQEKVAQLQEQVSTTTDWLVCVKRMKLDLLFKAKDHTKYAWEHIL